MANPLKGGLNSQPETNEANDVGNVSNIMRLRKEISKQYFLILN